MPFPPYFFFIAMKCLRLGSLLLGLYALVFQILKRFEAWNIYFIYPLGIALAKVFNPLSIPYTVWAVGADIQKDPRVGYGYRLDPQIDDWIKNNIRDMRSLVAVSPSIVEEFKQLDVVTDRVQLIPFGINTTHLRHQPISESLAKNRFGIDPSQNVLIAVGRNHPKKSFSLLLPVVHELRKRAHQIHLVIVGEGMKPLIQLTQEQGLEKHITFTGPLLPDAKNTTFPSEDLCLLYHLAKIFVLPSVIESFGIVTAEAMAAGLPIVAARAPGTVDIIGQAGLLCEPNNPQDMADKIIQILDSPPLHQSLAAHAIKQAQQYDWDVIVEKLEKILKSSTAKRLL